MKLTPWEKIMRAAKRHTGLRLTAFEVAQLSQDGAIETRAILDAEQRESQSDASGEGGT